MSNVICKKCEAATNPVGTGVATVRVAGVGVVHVCAPCATAFLGELKPQRKPIVVQPSSPQQKPTRR